MKDVNNIILIGRVVRLDEKNCGATITGRYKINFSIANNYTKKVGDKYVDEANFFDIEYWSSSDNMKQYLIKGTQVAISGVLRQDRWEKDGQKFSRLKIIADDIQLLGSKKDNAAQQSAPSNEQFQDYGF